MIGGGARGGGLVPAPTCGNERPEPANPVRGAARPYEPSQAPDRGAGDNSTSNRRLLVEALTDGILRAGAFEDPLRLADLLARNSTRIAHVDGNPQPDRLHQLRLQTPGDFLAAGSPIER